MHVGPFTFDIQPSPSVQHVQLISPPRTTSRASCVNEQDEPTEVLSRFRLLAVMHPQWKKPLLAANHLFLFFPSQARSVRIFVFEACSTFFSYSQRLPITVMAIHWSRYADR